MDRRELQNNPAETLQIAIRGILGDMWNALPGVVVNVDLTARTVDVQPAINGRARNLDGSYRSIQMPVLLDCPIVWQGGGGVTLTFPIKVNDECFVIFSSRCIDAWWQNGFQPPTPGTNPPVNQANDPLRLRMHSLSDGFAIVGIKNRSETLVVDTAHAMLQSDDGSTFIQLDPTGQAVKITAPGGINLNGATISSSGEITDGLGKVLGTHKHTGVSTGSGLSGPPQ
jgi:Phage protein Gp138 N-terminal domain/GpV Apex motif